MRLAVVRDPGRVSAAAVTRRSGWPGPVVDRARAVRVVRVRRAQVAVHVPQGRVAEPDRLLRAGWVPEQWRRRTSQRLSWMGPRPRQPRVPGTASQAGSKPGCSQMERQVEYPRAPKYSPRARWPVCSRPYSYRQQAPIPHWARFRVCPPIGRTPVLVGLVGSPMFPQCSCRVRGWLVCFRLCSCRRRARFRMCSRLG